MIRPIFYLKNDKIKKLSLKLLNAKTNKEVISSILKGLKYLSDDDYKYKTPLSQIYKRSSVGSKLQTTYENIDIVDIIPEFCFGCFKVQVEVPTVIDLIKVTQFSTNSNFEEDLSKKTIIELRPNICYKVSFIVKV